MEVDILKTRIGQIAGCISTLEAGRCELNNKKNLLSVCWLGGSADMVIYELDTWSRQFERLLAELTALHELAGREIDQWVQTDSEGAQKFRSISGMSRVVAVEIPTGDNSAQTALVFTNPDGSQDFVLLDGAEVEAYAGYLSGELTFDDVLEFIKTDPFKKQYFEGKATFWEADTTILDGAVWRRDYSDPRFGDLELKAGAAELTGEASLSYGKEGFRAKGDLELDAYLGKATYNGAIAGTSIAAVGMIGANAALSGGAYLNPTQGDLGAKVGGEAFVGGKLDGSVSKDFDVGGIEGSGQVRGGVSYGLGIEAKADIGMDNWDFKGEVDIGATVGLGVNIGFTFELDLSSVAETVVKTGQLAADYLFPI